jgi:hypothetical protein
MNFCCLKHLNEKGYLIAIKISSFHAPNNERYHRLRDWGYRWCWSEPFFKTRSDLMMLVAHTLRTFGLHMGDEVRLAPSRPLHVHTSMVSEENVAFVNEPSTLRPEGMLDQLPSLVKRDGGGDEPGEDHPDDDQMQVVRKELSIFTTTLDMAKQPLPNNAQGWLPESGAYDIVVVAVQVMLALCSATPHNAEARLQHTPAHIRERIAAR